MGSELLQGKQLELSVSQPVGVNGDAEELEPDLASEHRRVFRRSSRDLQVLRGERDPAKAAPERFFVGDRVDLDSTGEGRVGDSGDLVLDGPPKFFDELLRRDSLQRANVATVHLDS